MFSLALLATLALSTAGTAAAPFSSADTHARDMDMALVDWSEMPDRHDSHAPFVPRGEITPAYPDSNPDDVFASEEYRAWVASANPGDVYKYPGGSVRLNVPNEGAQPDLASNSSTGTTVQARTIYPCFAVATQTIIEATGTFWTPWITAPRNIDCKYCGDETCFFGWDWGNIDSTSFKEGWGRTKDGEMALFYEDTTITDLINANPAFNHGRNWAPRRDESGRYVCGAKRGDTVNLWEQVENGWVRARQRFVTDYTVGEGDSSCTHYDGKSLEIEDWQVLEAIYPLTGAEAMRFGCSFNEKSGCY